MWSDFLSQHWRKNSSSLIYVTQSYLLAVSLTLSPILIPFAIWPFAQPLPHPASKEQSALRQPSHVDPTSVQADPHCPFTMYLREVWQHCGTQGARTQRIRPDQIAGYKSAHLYSHHHGQGMKWLEGSSAGQLQWFGSQLYTHVRSLVILFSLLTLQFPYAEMRINRVSE